MTAAIAEVAAGTACPQSTSERAGRTQNAVTAAAPAQHDREVGARLWGGITACFGVATGVAPHLLHHVGPLAGAALLAGFGGQALFFVLGLAMSVPLLLKFYRRFGTLVAPAVALVVFAAIFTFSSVVVAPRLTGNDGSPASPIEQPRPQDHGHHPEGERR